MKTKKLRFIMRSFAILIAICGGNNSRALASGVCNSGECSELAPLIQKLRSLDETKRRTAKTSILLFSSGSSESRQCVITAMLKIFLAASTDPEGGFMLAIKSPGRYAQWSEATDILGTLKTTEAMDSLIDNLAFNDGRTSFGIGHYPATRAVVKFGAQAIPKLEVALREKPPDTRTMAALALHAIGGEKAKLILEEALKMEMDEGVATRIRNILIGWTSSGKPQP